MGVRKTQGEAAGGITSRLSPLAAQGSGVEYESETVSYVFLKLLEKRNPCCFMRLDSHLLSVVIICDVLNQCLMEI